MALSLDDLTTPLPADGSVLRDDLVYLFGLLGWPVAKTPGRGRYQLCSGLGRWGTRLWNGYAIPAIRGGFGDTAAGDWATLFWRGKGTDRGTATYASAPVTFENRSGIGVDISAPGAVQVAYNGQTFTSQGPPPGQTGFLALWPGSGPYPQAVVLLQCDVTGTKGNVPANGLAGYPTALASGPPGVYVATSGSTPPAGNPALIASNGESDAQLQKRGRAAQALGAPAPVVDKIVALVLGTVLPSGVAVATNRVRVIGANGAASVVCATPSGPTTGSTGDPTTELGAIDARLQLLAGLPGWTLTTAAASLLSISGLIITLYVTKKSNVSADNATATAQAALDFWQANVLPIGGMRKVPGGQGYVFADELSAIAKSRVNASYPPQWLPNTSYEAGSPVSNLGQTFVATATGVSGVTGPTGAGGPDGVDGLAWTPSAITGSGTQFDLAAGVFAAKVETAPNTPFTDTAVAATQIPVLSYTIAVVIVDQGT